jgi:preprotein translocase subunit Sec61beta
MARENIRMPSSSAGVMTFYDEERSKVKITPTHVVILSVIVALFILLLEHSSIFG